LAPLQCLKDPRAKTDMFLAEIFQLGAHIAGFYACQIITRIPLVTVTVMLS